MRARAPELFYQVKIAEQIRGLEFSPAVFLEYAARDALQPRRGPPPRILRSSKNIDILVAPRKGDDGPFRPFRIALEIKPNVSRWDQIKNDVRRLSALVRSEGFRMGLSLFLMWHSVGERGNDTSDEKWQDMKDEMEKYNRANRDLKLSLIDPKEGGERRSVRRDNGKIQCHAWYVSGVDIRESTSCH